MLVICIRCRRVVGCATLKGKPIDNCYHCPSKECREQMTTGKAIIMEVIVSKFRSCLDHDSPHIGYTQKPRK